MLQQVALRLQPFHPAKVCIVSCKCAASGAGAQTPRQRRLATQKRKWEQEQGKVPKPSAPAPEVPADVQLCSSDSARAASHVSASTSRPHSAAAAPKPHSQRSAHAKPKQHPPTTSQTKASGKQAQVHAAANSAAQAHQHAVKPERTWQPWSVFSASDTAPKALLTGLTGAQLSELALHWADEAATRITTCAPPACGETDAAPATAAAPLRSSSIWPLLSQDEQAAVTAQVTALAQEALARLSAAAAAAREAHVEQAQSGAQSPQVKRASEPADIAQHKQQQTTQPSYSDALSQQQHADIEWSVAHFARGTPDAAAHLAELGEQLHAAMAVPFRVLPLFLPGLALEPFMSEITLRRDTIYLDGGTRAVEESRLTGWQSGIGATFKYSGKEMVPEAGAGLSPLVTRVRDTLQQCTGVLYNSVLVNLYENGQCGMRYHVDPLYGCWTTNQAVVSVGATRKFAFREAADYEVRWTYRVRSGDVVLMFGPCQERLQHAVIVDKLQSRQGIAGPRMSLVFKQHV